MGSERRADPLPDPRPPTRNGGFGRVECGFGFDVVIADPSNLDAVLPGCEYVRRY
ncbi:hypothetical protein ABZX75_12220 [Streptomyces sp. NPDC003038]|uniref:hypothetical protein n=1 Tax=unclassified Streptomyces TaxID=2593676 RepID=UPI0033B15F7F